MMKKTIFYIALIFICTSALCNNSVVKKELIQSNEIIPWSVNKRLTWSDFRGIPRNKNTNKVAETNSMISISYKYSKKGVTSYTVVSTFNKNKSWTISNKKDVLAHEQLHFDITELYARKIRKEFGKLLAKESNLKNYSKVYSKYINEWKKEQVLYDSQVYNNKVMQNKWIAKIENELKELDKYKL